MILLSAFLIGVIAGLRALTAPTLVSWAVRAGWLPLDGTWLQFLGYRWTPWVLSVAALAELINDKLPQTPSRKIPPQFIARVLTGALSGGAIAAVHNGILLGSLVGGAGAVVGTLGGAEVRNRLVEAIGGRDLPIALLEDAIAVLGAMFIVRQFS